MYRILITFYYKSEPSNHELYYESHTFDDVKDYARNLIKSYMQYYGYDAYSLKIYECNRGSDMYINKELKRLSERVKELEITIKSNQKRIESLKQWLKTPFKQKLLIDKKGK